MCASRLPPCRLGPGPIPPTSLRYMMASCGLYRWESVVPNGVVRPEADPVGDRPVLLLGLRKLLLGTERLVALYSTECRSVIVLQQYFAPSKLPSGGIESVAPSHAGRIWHRRVGRGGGNSTAARRDRRIGLETGFTYRHLG